MPTIYELDYSWIDESLAQIKTTAILSVWDCVAKSWSSKPKVTLRNTLLSGLHQDAGKERFCIGEIPTTTKDLEFRLNGTSRTQVAQSCKTDK